MVLILLAWDSILWFTKSSFNFRRSSWQNSRYTIKIDWQAFFLLLNAIFVSFFNNLNPPKINQNFVYILIFGLVFITINSKIIWNKNILDSKKKNFASADNHLYIKSLHLWSQLMYWKKKPYHVVIVTKVAECLSIYKMECCHGDEIDEQANKNGGNDFWHKHTRQRLKTKHYFVSCVLRYPRILICHKGFALYCTEQVYIDLSLGYYKCCFYLDEELFESFSSSWLEDLALSPCWAIRVSFIL